MDLSNLTKFDLIIDVRTKREFSHSRIPNAINLPIFSNSEFEKIGLLYKQNPLQANFLGASIACRNIADILENNKNILKHKFKILLYCARGGNRSLSLYQVLKSLKFQVSRLEGGYKAYRNAVIDFLNSPIKRDFLTLCGNTGCGKSELIELNSTWGIDLEKLANHYGSSFGFISGTQPSVKMFENSLTNELMNKESSILLIENESKKLGNIIIPNTLYTAYQNSKKILITCDLECRIERTLKLYKDIKQDDFINTMQKISPYISKETKFEILKSWDNGDKRRIAKLLLVKYYDKVYKQIDCDFKVDSTNLELANKEIAEIKNKIESH